ncbi:SgcJ/EcaC family oxidoreductase [Geodermatophilus sp. YIM 151500]|uniref:SgcJ/EcaC family oxidoreductase n=1 Tax=Geodermatophilus sp. YIM 151500 TaxID=2984531 RepID=UPI0021E3B6EC|nr:SgcJ/EcaC family oxidoreductase [Geodermatophilus sp. YIM 151500]MCV2489266.1 SgcJ/EcaC family oxidoreductase [Geodermatophilus sp. YIM 151500]
MSRAITAADADLVDLFERMCAAWTAGDADGYGACSTEDGDYVSYDGARARGRRVMVENHDRLFRGVLTGSALVGQVESVRHLRDDVAVVHATGSVLMPWRASVPGRRLSRQTIVAVRTDHGWRIAALHNGRVRPVRIPAPDSLPSRASRAMTRRAGPAHRLGRRRRMTWGGRVTRRTDA